MLRVEAPDWLTKRGGELRGSKDGHSCTVYFAGQPQYLLEPVPAAGRFACRVTQTINGRRLEGKETFKTREEALQGGLEDLRNALGW
jgi:hypothetical protein